MKPLLIPTLSMLAFVAHGAAAQDAAPERPQAAPSNTASLNTAGEIRLAQMRGYLDILAGLEAQGYQIDEVKRTFLGRIMITARNTVHLREVVVSRSTGEIMSDVILKVFADEAEKDAPGTATTGASGGASVSVGATIGIGTKKVTGSVSSGTKLGLGN